MNIHCFIIDVGTDRSQSMGVIVIAEKSENNASRNEESDRTCPLSRESVKRQIGIVQVY